MKKEKEIKIVKRKLDYREPHYLVFLVWALFWLIPPFVTITHHTGFAITWLISFPISYILSLFDIEEKVYRVKARLVR